MQTNTSNKVKAKNKSSYDSGAASEYLVLSILYRLGINAFITLGNKKSIDILIKAHNGLALSVDVKSVRDYSSIIINNVRHEINHFVIIVVYKKKFEDVKVLPDFYIVPSEKILALQRTFKKEIRLMTGSIKEYQNKWELLAI